MRTAVCKHFLCFCPPPALGATRRQSNARLPSTIKGVISRIAELCTLYLAEICMAEVSVLMPVWNGEKHLRAAVDSVLGQTFTDLELLVINDGSTDGTADILGSYQDPRLRVFHRPHEGIIPTRNYGVSQARGEWIACLDADDISVPERLAEQLKLLWKHPEAVLCFADVEFFGHCAPLVRARLPRSRGMLAMKMCMHCPIVASTVVFKKTAFHKAGGYLLEEPHAEDYGLWGRLIELGPFVSVRRALVRFRRHEHSDSQLNSERQIASGEKVALGNCRRFMRLDEATAQRAFQILKRTPSQRSPLDWAWFLIACAPRLQWKSGELLAWLAKQTVASLAGVRR
jgi:glycosyltransferase involved in cell wall biosynthesis